MKVLFCIRTLGNPSFVITLSSLLSIIKGNDDEFTLAVYDSSEESITRDFNVCAILRILVKKGWRIAVDFMEESNVGGLLYKALEVAKANYDYLFMLDDDVIPVGCTINNMLSLIDNKIHPFITGWEEQPYVDNTEDWVGEIGTICDTACAVFNMDIIKLEEVKELNEWDGGEFLMISKILGKGHQDKSLLFYHLHDTSSKKRRWNNLANHWDFVYKAIQDGYRKGK